MTSPDLNNIQGEYSAQKVVTDSLDAIAELLVGILEGCDVNAVADVVDARPMGGKISIGWSVTLNGVASDRLRRFRKRINTTPNAMAMATPPMIPPTMAGAFDLREDTEGVDEVVGTSVEDGVSDVLVATINSGL